MGIHESLLQADFENVYKTYADNLARKNQIFRFTIYFAIAPYLVVISLISTKNLSINDLLNLESLHTVMYLVAMISGVGMLLPLFHFVENDDNLMRCARAINSFRKYYNKKMSTDNDWSVNLPININYPKERAISSSGTFIFLIFYSISTLYSTVGFFGLFNLKAFSTYYYSAFILLEAIGILIYFLTGNSKEFPVNLNCETESW